MKKIFLTLILFIIFAGCSNKDFSILNKILGNPISNKVVVQHEEKQKPEPEVDHQKQRTEKIHLDGTKKLKKRIQDYNKSKRNPSNQIKSVVIYNFEPDSQYDDQKENEMLIESAKRTKRTSDTWRGNIQGEDMILKVTPKNRMKTQDKLAKNIKKYNLTFVKMVHKVMDNTVNLENDTINLKITNKNVFNLLINRKDRTKAFFQNRLYNWKVGKNKEIYDKLDKLIKRKNELRKEVQSLKVKPIAEAETNNLNLINLTDNINKKQLTTTSVSQNVTNTFVQQNSIVSQDDNKTEPQNISQNEKQLTTTSDSQNLTTTSVQQQLKDIEEEIDKAKTIINNENSALAQELFDFAYQYDKEVYSKISDHDNIKKFLRKETNSDIAFTKLQDKTTQKQLTAILCNAQAYVTGRIESQRIESGEILGIWAQLYTWKPGKSAEMTGEEIEAISDRAKTENLKRNIKEIKELESDIKEKFLRMIDETIDAFPRLEDRIFAINIAKDAIIDEKLTVSQRKVALLNLINQFKVLKTANENHELIKKMMKNFIFFKTGKYELNKQAKEKLDTIANRLTANKPSDLKVTLIGRTDYTGSSYINEELSKERIKAVKDYLLSKGVREEYFFKLIPKGSADPIDNLIWRTINRTVEIQIELKE
ncbi:hypothetical protein GMMP1_1110028 [Candidatus Magnetomoraceae bacterium gMMP-1]